MSKSIILIKQLLGGQFRVKTIEFEFDSYKEAALVIAKQHPDYMLMHGELFCPITVDCTYFTEVNSGHCESWAVTYKQHIKDRVKFKTDSKRPVTSVNKPFVRILVSKSGMFGSFLENHVHNRWFANEKTFLVESIFNKPSMHWDKIKDLIFKDEFNNICI